MGGDDCVWSGRTACGCRGQIGQTGGGGLNMTNRKCPFCRTPHHLCSASSLSPVRERYEVDIKVTSKGSSMFRRWRFDQSHLARGQRVKALDAEVGACDAGEERCADCRDEV